MSYKSIAEVQKALETASEAAGAYTAITNGLNNSFLSRGTVSVRNEYNRSNYENVRPSERLPTGDRDIMQACNQAYYNVGIVRNIVDLMADFCVKGIDWAHTNKNIQAFYRAWFRKVQGYDVSERFCNYLIRLGNNCIYTNYAKIPQSSINEWRKTKGAEFQNISVTNRKIPSKYFFVDPTALSEVAPEIGKFADNRMFMMSLAGGLVNSFSKTTKNMVGGSQFDIGNIIRSIPADLRNKITENNGNIVFTEDDFKLHHYKKDDWDSWAKPVVFSVLEPLILLQKMHLADMSALDGAISNIRLWRVGYIDQTNALNSIIPTKNMLNKVREIVLNNISGGVLDLFWGPDLDFKESSSSVHQFLGPEKYQHVMAMIYYGFGISPALIGGSGADSPSGGLSGNYMSMKVMVERLAYLRNKLTDFWTEEAKQIQLAMGFSSPAKLVFDTAVLSDETQYKQLLLDMYDREIISLEGIREELNLVDPIETSRILRETKRRDKDKIPPKAGPYHDPMWKISLESKLVTEGAMDPEDLGIDADPVEPEAVGSPRDGGRPIGKKDKVKRKQKVVNPRSAAAEVIQTQVWAKESIDKIGEFITSKFLELKGRAYVRELVNSEVDDLEDLKLGILCAHAPFQEITEDSVGKACTDLPEFAVEKQAQATIIEKFIDKFGRKPTIEDRRIAAAAAYAVIKNSEK